MQYQGNYLNIGLKPEAIRSCGFEQASFSSVPRYLYQAQLTKKASCIRDTVMNAMWNFQKLQKILVNAGTVKKWKFYHIIFWTIADDTSTIKKEYAINEIIRMSLSWQVASFKTFFVPICMNDYDLLEVQNYCDIGGPDWIVSPTINHNFGQSIYNVMREIDLKMSINQSFSAFNQDNLMSVNPYDDFSTAVTFSVQASSSFLGQKWQAITNGITNYIRNMKSRDIVSGIIFCSELWVVGKVNHQRQQPAVAQSQANRAAEPLYQAYAQDRRRRGRGRGQQQGRTGRNCAYCFCILIVLFLVWLIKWLVIR